MKNSPNQKTTSIDGPAPSRQTAWSLSGGWAAGTRGSDGLRSLGNRMPAVMAFEIDLSRPDPLRPLRRLHEEIEGGDIRILGLLMPGESVLRARCRKLGVQLFSPDIVGPDAVVEETRAITDFENWLASRGEGSRHRDN